MRLTFSQGLARYQTDVYATPTFLQKSSQTGEYIDLVVSPDPTIIVFAHRDSAYVVEESKTVSHAWGPFPSSGTKYLYWDLNLLDASLTRGFTTYPQLVSGTPPQNPAIDQHWFDTSQKQMKVWNGSKWIDKLRVFGATYSSSAIIQPQGLGSQVNLTGSFDAGNLIFDSFNKPLRQSDGTFVTSTTELGIIDAGTTKVKFEAEIISGMADEYIPKFSLVQVRPDGKLVLARSDDWRSRIGGLVDEDLYKSEIGIVTADGLIRNEQWSWPVQSIGRPIFCGLTGQITLVPPIVGVSQISGYVHDVDSVFLNIQPVVILDDVSHEVSAAPAPINPPPVADFHASPQVGTSPLSVSFTSTSLHNPTVYEWDFGNDGIIDATSQNATRVFTSPGVYSVRLRVKNQFGQDDEVKTNLITVNSPVVVGLKTNLDIQLSGPLQVAKSERFTLSAIISNAGHLTATNVIRTLTIEDMGNDIPVISALPTGSTSARVGKSTVITLPLIISLVTGGSVVAAFSITAPGSTGDIKITGTVSSPEQDSGLSDNVTDLSVKVK